MCQSRAWSASSPVSSARRNHHGTQECNSIELANALLESRLLDDRGQRLIGQNGVEDLGKVVAVKRALGGLLRRHALTRS